MFAIRLFVCLSFLFAAVCGWIDLVPHFMLRNVESQLHCWEAFLKFIFFSIQYANVLNTSEFACLIPDWNIN